MEDVAGKIKKLLKLGESPNANEAAAAIAKAQSLMERHRIDVAMLEIEQVQPEEEIGQFADPLDQGHTASWRGRLALVLCRANGCVVYRGHQRLMLVGHPSNASAVRYLYGYCTNEIQRLARKHARGNGRAWRDNFRTGCIDAIDKAIRAERAAMHDELRKAAAERVVVDSRALVVVNNAIAKVEQQKADVDAWVDQNMKLRAARSRAQKYYPTARELGRTHGAGIYPGRTSGALSGPGPKQITGGK